MILCHRWIFAVLIVGGSTFFPKDGQSTATLAPVDKQRFVQAMHNMLRNVTELPLMVRSEVHVRNGAGRLLKHIRNQHRFLLSPVSDDGTKVRLNGNVKKVPGGFVGDQIVDTDVAAVLTGLALGTKNPADAYDLSYVPGSQPQEMIIVFRSRASCNSFEARQSKWRLREWCGSGRVVVEKETFRPIRAEFRAGGLPIRNRKHSLVSYSIDETFETAGSDARNGWIVFPKNLTATYITDQSTTTVTNFFQLL